jgi:hypothetical protein
MRLAGRRDVITSGATRETKAPVMISLGFSFLLIGLMIACAIADAIPVGRAQLNALWVARREAKRHG